MANPTMTLIASNTVGSSGVSSVTFSSIPQTYTNLLVKMSSRNTSTSGSAWGNTTVQFNGSSTGYNMRFLYGSGSGTGSGVDTIINTATNDSSSTASTFANTEFYIPNYTSSNYKSVSIDTVTENNATAALADLVAALWSNTAAITSISIASNTGNFAQYSTFYLYGISNS
jgi:hypothetical protein